MTACVLPSATEMRTAFRAFRARWPWVTAFGAWNEGNHAEPADRGPPAAAAELYTVLAEACPECRIAAADVVDSANMTAWVRAFLAALPERPRLWGLHNYGDVTRARTTMTEALLALVDGDVWITETGGIVRCVATGPTTRPGPARASSGRSRSPTRTPTGSRALYLYQWRAAAHGAVGLGAPAPRRHAAPVVRGAGRAPAPPRRPSRLPHRHAGARTGAPRAPPPLGRPARDRPRARWPARRGGPARARPRWSRARQPGSGQVRRPAAAGAGRRPAPDRPGPHAHAAAAAPAPRPAVLCRVAPPRPAAAALDAARAPVTRRRTAAAPPAAAALERARAR